MFRCSTGSSILPRIFGPSNFSAFIFSITGLSSLLLSVFSDSVTGLLSASVLNYGFQQSTGNGFFFRRCGFFFCWFFFLFCLSLAGWKNRLPRDRSYRSLSGLPVQGLLSLIISGSLLRRASAITRCVGGSSVTASVLPRQPVLLLLRLL